MQMRWAGLVTLMAICLPAWADEHGSKQTVPAPLKAGAAKHGGQPPREATTGPKPKAITPPTTAEIDASIRRGIEYLLKSQHKDGSWGSANSSRPPTAEVNAPVPGAHQAFKAAVTAMCIEALMETGGNDPQVLQAIDRAEVWLFQRLPHVRRPTPREMYNVWTHGYGLQCLLKMLDRKPEDAARQEKINEMIKQQIDLLRRYEVVSGGWAYYEFGARTQPPSWTSMSFCTCAILVALHDARERGFDVPQPMIDKAIESVLRQRRPDFSILYAETHIYKPMKEVNRPMGSLGRSQAANFAMRIWGDKLVTDEVIKTWLDRLFARQLWVEIGRKRPVPHEAWAKVAGYFYYFGHYYAARCIELLPEKDRPHFQDQLAHLIIPLQEKDGSWWDFPIYDYHQAYGTAFALMTLQRTRKVGS